MVKQKAMSGKTNAKSAFLPIVAIGASAGGLEAVLKLLKSLIHPTGLSFVYVQHLSPDHPSSLPELLATATTMNVHEAVSGTPVETDNLYVCTPNKEIQIVDGILKLTPRNSKQLPYLPINTFFLSLAGGYGPEVIGIVLSGNATDGTIGLSAIKEAGGVTFAQDSSAKYSSMPKSAIDQGVVDFVMSPRQIAIALMRIGKTGLAGKAVPTAGKPGQGNFDRYLKSVFSILHKRTGVDFNRYKTATLTRRLKHRMVQTGIKSIATYLKLLTSEPGEADFLYRDLLINVTGFFRDTESFNYLKSDLLPLILKAKKPGDTLRIWVPACSRGAEAYSIAMLIRELEGKKKSRVTVQLFATDLSETVIRDARIGRYSQAEVAAVSPARLKRFFTKTDGTYQVKKELREMCVFAPHNILSDPPFSRMDFISCRNLLIYFDAAAQRRVLSTLHFVLNEDGYLMLGKAETTGTSSLLFKQVNSRFKIYLRKKNIGLRKTPDLHSATASRKNPDNKIVPKAKKASVISASDLDAEIDTFLLTHRMPACAVINQDMEILQFRGDAALYLKHPSGKASLNVLKMMRPEFAFELRSAVQQVISSGKHISKSGMEITVHAESRMMSLDVYPLKQVREENLLIILFSLQESVPVGNSAKSGINDHSKQQNGSLKKLREELRNSRSEIHMVLESQEVAYEKLQAANEEIVSTNEEFQTLNEELETSKEEIEASNEELMVTNLDLKKHNALLAESYEYSQTIIATIHEPMLVLNSQLNVKFANRSFYTKFNTHPEKTEGMNLFKIGNGQWNIPRLRGKLEKIFSKNTHFENFEVTHHFPEIGEKIILLNANRLIQKAHQEKLILLAIEDITELSLFQQNEKKHYQRDLRHHKKDVKALGSAVNERTIELEAKNKELENANRDLVSFTHISSHDLQEPLRKIQTFVDRLLTEEKDNLSADGKMYLQRTVDTARRMRLLIDDLLTYSRTKSTDRKFEKVELKTIVDLMRVDFKETLAEQNATIKTGKLCPVLVIRFQFMQLFQNLISNSLKFASPDRPCVITIKTEIVKQPKLSGVGNPKTSYCHITYADNGIGFESQYNERIFEVFQRLHSRGEYPGTGIGLAICRRVIENHRGTITAEGYPGKGARFDIYIPTA